MNVSYGLTIAFFLIHRYEKASLYNLRHLIAGNWLPIKPVYNAIARREPRFHESLEYLQSLSIQHSFRATTT